MIIFDLPPQIRDFLSDKQLETKKYFLINGGRGSTKSQSVLSFFIEKSYEEKYAGAMFGCYRDVAKVVDDTMMRLFTILLEKAGLLNDWSRKHNKYINKKTKVEVIFDGLKDFSNNASTKQKNLEKIKGMTKLAFVFFDESAGISLDLLYTLVPSARDTKVLLDKNYVKKAKIKEVQDDYIPFNAKFIFVFNRQSEVENCEEFVAPYENKDYLLINITDLAPRFQNPDLLKQMQDMKDAGDINYKHVWLGFPRELDFNSVIKRNDICYKHATDFDSVVVGVDPAGSAHKGSDKTGIVVVGKKDDIAYILDDLTGVYTPTEWVKVVHDAMETWGGDAIIVEINFGGDLVRETIRVQHPYYTIIPARAKASGNKRLQAKAVRFSPIANLIKNKKVFFAKKMLELEKQIFNFSIEAYRGEGSPDRVDAMAYAVWYSLLNPKANKNDVYIF